MDEITMSLVAYEMVSLGLVVLTGALLGALAADVTHWWQKRRAAQRQADNTNEKQGPK